MSKFWLAMGGVVAATLVDLIYMFWSRTGQSTPLTKASWNSSSMGKGKFDVIKTFKNYNGNQ